MFITFAFIVVQAWASRPKWINPRHESIRAEVFNNGLIKLKPVRALDDGGALARTFGVVTFDLRASRGGNGDVAAAYLMALEWRHRFAFTGQITFLMRPQTRQILSRLVGRRVHARDRLDDDVTIVDAYDIPADLAPADLFVQLAAKNGEDSVPTRFRNVEIHGHGADPERAPVHARTVFVTAPVFAASETTTYQSETNLRYRGVTFALPPPGPGAIESGIYYDVEAARLASMTPHEILRRLERLPMGPLVARWLALDRVPVLAYGLSHEVVKEQFREYLRGVLRDEKRPVLILTPSTVELKDVIDVAPGAITVLGADEPAVDDGARISIVRLPTVPHVTFSALLALSRELPALVAGDSALSAVTQLGGRFAMTRVHWNEKIAHEIFSELSVEASSVKSAQSFRRVARGELSGALGTDARAFRDRAARAHYFSDTLLHAIARARNIVDHEVWSYSAVDLRRLLARRLNFRVAVDQLREGRARPFDAKDLKYFVWDNLGTFLRHGCVTTEDLAHADLRAVIQERADLVVDYEGRSVGAYLHGVNGDLSGLERILREAGEVCRKYEEPLNENEGYSAVIEASDAFESIRAVGGDAALAVIRRVGLTFPRQNIAKDSMLLHLNDLVANGRGADVRAEIAAMASTAREALLRTAMGAKDIYARPLIIETLASAVTLDKRRADRVAARLASWRECEAGLAADRPHPEMEARRPVKESIVSENGGAPTSAAPK